ANISHELRTPLVPIKGYAMMLGRGRLRRDEARAGLAAIENAAEQLERVIGRLLEVAGGTDPGDQVVPRTTTEVRPVIDSLVRRWKARVGDRRPITRRIARNLPDLVVDRHRLEESLDELMDNAVKFSPEDSRILVTARLVDGFVPDVAAGEPGQPWHAVEISVDDLGIGIAEDELGRVFEDFAQADSTATRSFGGLGLGLSVVRRMVEAHGGELVCETEEGKGSRFSILLPVLPIQGRENA
ncbi:MAG: sensor histidine kinase, partial [Acidimicrobiales bacterium]